MKIYAFWGSICLLICTLLACNRSESRHSDQWSAYGTERIDSMAFIEKHHYWRNYNFKATDTLTLTCLLPGENALLMPYDSLKIFRNEQLVVADVSIQPADTIDSVWVKVARDQATQGWMREGELLKRVVPNNPISVFIHNFSDRRMLVLLGCLGFSVLFFLVQLFRRERFMLVHFNDIKSFYPTLLCLLVSGAAALYGSVQHFVPQTWEDFYFHPTLNPFTLPPVLAFFIASVWAIIIVAIAMIEDLRKQPDVVNAVSYLAGLSGVCMLLYLFFTLTVHYYIGYLFLPLYWGYAICQHLRNNTVLYVCGQCGRNIRHLGKCPHCGAINVK